MLNSYNRKAAAVLDKGDASAALLTALTKLFDCFPHKLLITKPLTWGVEILSL